MSDERDPASPRSHPPPRTPTSGDAPGSGLDRRALDERILQRRADEERRFARFLAEHHVSRAAEHEEALASMAREAIERLDRELAECRAAAERELDEWRRAELARVERALREEERHAEDRIERRRQEAERDLTERLARHRRLAFGDALGSAGPDRDESAHAEPASADRVRTDPATTEPDRDAPGRTEPASADLADRSRVQPEPPGNDGNQTVPTRRGDGNDDRSSVTKDEPDQGHHSDAAMADGGDSATIEARTRSALAQAGSVREMGPILRDAVRPLAGASAFAIVLFHPTHDEVVYRYRVGAEDELSVALGAQPVDESRDIEAVRSERPYSTFVRTLRIGEADERTVSVAQIPLCDEGGVSIGIATLQTSAPDGFREEGLAVVAGLIRDAASRFADAHRLRPLRDPVLG